MDGCFQAMVRETVRLRWDFEGLWLENGSDDLTFPEALPLAWNVFHHYNEPRKYTFIVQTSAQNKRLSWQKCVCISGWEQSPWERPCLCHVKTWHTSLRLKECLDDLVPSHISHDGLKRCHLSFYRQVFLKRFHGRGGQCHYFLQTFNCVL